MLPFELKRGGVQPDIIKVIEPKEEETLGRPTRGYSQPSKASAAAAAAAASAETA